MKKRTLVKKMVFSLLFAGLMVLSSQTAFADKVYEFNFACHDSSKVAFATALNQWVEDLKTASNGKIQVTIFYGGSLAAKKDEVNLLESGSIDMAWIGVNSTAGRTPGTEVFYLPYLGSTNPLQHTAALLDVYNNMDTVKNEWNMFHMLALHANGMVPISTTSKKIETLEDIKGVRLRTGVANLVTFLKYLKAVPTAFSPMESYENLSKNVVDGVCDDWTLIDGQNLREVLKYIMDVAIMTPLGAVVMNKEAYEDLPADLQKILDDTSKDLSFKMSATFNDTTSKAVAEAKAAGVEIYDPSSELLAAFKEAAQYTKDQWIADMAKKGRDGQAIYDAAVAAIERNAAAYEKYNP